MWKRAVIFGALAAMLPGCGWDGHLNIFGYTTRPNYDPTIHYIYVPIFANQTMYREWEMELTRAVIKEIELRTPYRVVSNREDADTELQGKIVSIVKNLVNTNQLNEIREGQVIMNVEFLWRDLRPGQHGKILSSERQGGTRAPINPLDPLAPEPPPPPTVISVMANFVPEVGGSMTSSQTQLCNTAAIRVVSMMEVWPGPVGAPPGPLLPAAPP